jgi:hypothetical protein
MYGRRVASYTTDQGACVASLPTADGRTYRVVGRPRKYVDRSRHEVGEEVERVARWLEALGL